MSIDDYLKQVNYGDYEELPIELYEFISMEGWLVSLETEHNQEYNQEDFEYLVLNLSEYDKKGLIAMNTSVLEKFNEFDLALKKHQEYPYDTLDFMDYDNGIVYIIRLL